MNTDAISLCIALGALWFAWHVVLRPTLIDYSRNRLIGIRDETFDYMALGHVDQSDPAYVLLRQFQNVSIRYAERMTMTNITLAWLMTRNRATPQFQERLTASATGLSAEQAQHFAAAHLRTTRALGLHVLTCSILGLLVFAAIITAAAGVVLLAGSLRAMKTRLDSQLARGGSAAMEPIAADVLRFC